MQDYVHLHVHTQYSLLDGQSKIPNIVNKAVANGMRGVYYPLKLELEGKNAKETMQGISDVVRRNGDFEASYSGAYFSNNKMVEELALVLFIAVILLYLILASQFESLMQPFIILSEIIIDIFFSLLVLWICGVSINLMSMIGLVVVCGIIIKNSRLGYEGICVTSWAKVRGQIGTIHATR